MPKKSYTEEQLVAVLCKDDSGLGVADVCRESGVTEMTLYRWNRSFAGVGLAKVRQLKVLEEENRKLKQLVADLAMDKSMLQELLSKKL